MHFLFHLLKKYPFSTFCIALIWILSFVPFFPETPLDNVEFIDKWIHVIMYGGTFTILWIEYIFFWAWLMPVAMSGIIELLQEYCTGGTRSGEWLDLAANSTGITLAAVIGLLIYSLARR